MIKSSAPLVPGSRIHTLRTSIFPETNHLITTNVWLGADLSSLLRESSNRITMVRLFARVLVCLSLVLLSGIVEAQVLRQYTVETALADLEKGTADLILVGGIAPIVYTGQEGFKEKYGIGYNDFGDLPACSDEEMIAYNAVLFSWLYDHYGLEWLNDVRSDVEGLREWKKNKTSLQGFLDGQGYSFNDTDEISFDRDALIVVDGIVWKLQDEFRELLDSTNVTLAKVLDYTQFISMQDIESIQLINKSDFPWCAPPKDIVLIRTKKESAIKSFILNGKIKQRHRGISLGNLLMDEAALKRQIQEQWRINPKRITCLTVEGKSISITTK